AGDAGRGGGVPEALMPALGAELRRLLDGLAQALAEGETERAWDLAHQLSGLAGIYRLGPLSVSARRLESCCRDGRLDEAGKVLAELERQARLAGFAAAG
ncbi:MAG: Hpt domain-containing protein, partial [Gammaproteobacteria bacterium]